MLRYRFEVAQDEGGFWSYYTKDDETKNPWDLFETRNQQRSLPRSPTERTA
jgi:hypothetical protein